MKKQPMVGKVLANHIWKELVFCVYIRHEKEVHEKIFANHIWRELIFSIYKEVFLLKVLLFIYLFIYSITCLCHCGYMVISFILWVIVQYYFIHFFAQIVPALDIRSSFNWLLCPFDRLPISCCLPGCLFPYISTALFSVLQNAPRLILFLS